MGLPVVHFEVIGKDAQKLQSFYGDLFDWKIDASNPMGYGMVEATEGRGIPGGVGQVNDEPHPRVLFYVSTTDIPDSLAKAEKLGGKTLMQRTELAGGTILGLFADPEGNPIGLVEEAA
jgi:predicted enzyme related to lactoylglutathione lyase